MGGDQPTSQTEAQILWSAAYALLSQDSQLSVRDRSIIKDLSPSMVWDSMIILTASNDFTRLTVENRFDGLVKDALSQAAGKAMNYVIKLDPGRDETNQDDQLGGTSRNDQGGIHTPTKFGPPSQSAPVIPVRLTVPTHLTSLPTQTLPVAVPVTTGLPTPSAETELDQSTYLAKATNILRPTSPVQSQTTAGLTAEVAQTDQFDQAPETLTAAPTSPTTQAAPAVQTTQRPEPTAEHVPFDMPNIQDTFPADSFLEPAKGQAASHRDEQSHLNKDATFDNFVPGESNRFAKAAAFAVAEAPGNAYNPLFIYGGSGLGKTHLLNAIGNYALTLYPNLRVRYVNSEEFTNEFIEAVKKGAGSDGQVAEFNRRYREVDILLIDDIQFLGDKTGTLETFFHTFNALYNANKQIVVASDVAPKLLEGFEDRIVSRFEQGLPVDIQPPNQETRVAILRIKATTSKLKTNVPLEVLDLIAQKVTDNVRELEGALTRVVAMASLNRQPVTAALAEQTLQDYFVSEVQVTPTDIISQTANYFQLTFDDLVSSNRSKAIALPRMIAMYICRELTGLSLTAIGETFGGRDHTTVIHAYQRISSEMSERREVYNYVSELTARLKQGMK